MGRTRQAYFQSRYFISAVRYSMLLEDFKNVGKSKAILIKENNIDNNIYFRFKPIEGTPRIDLNYVNIANTHDSEEWIEVAPEVVRAVKELINEGLSDEEIKSKVYIKLLKEGFKLENNKLINNEKISEYNVVLDMGNYSIKAKCGTNKFNITSKLFKGSMAELPNLQWIKHDGKKIYLGTENGEFIGEYDKVKKFDDVKRQILYTIDKVVEPNEDIYEVNLGYMLPISQTRRAAIIIESLQDHEFEFETQNGSRVISIRNVTIMPEGFSSSRIFTESEDMISYLDGELILIDLGSRTANVSTLIDGDISNADTLECGSFDLYAIIQNHLKNNKGKDKSIEKIASLYEKNKLEIEDSLLIDYLNKIKEALTGYSKDLEDYDNIVLTGGVAKLLETKTLSDGITLLDKLIEILGVDEEKVHVMENPTETNINGAMLLLQDMNNGAA